MPTRKQLAESGRSLETGIKPCSRCRTATPLTGFPPCKRSRTGRGSWCYVCCRAASRARRRAEGDALRASARARRAAEPERFIWRDMIRRCYSPTRADYSKYGGRGITVCERWRNSFDAFLADVGPRPPGLSIDRIDNNRGYEPGNVRWATQSQQTRNFSRNRYITAIGETLTLAEWSDRLGAPPRLIQQRLDYLGWDPERAVTTPAGGST